MARRNSISPGDRFGRLVVVKQVASAHGAACFEVRCDCDVVKVALGSNLRKGHTRSCGCLRKEAVAARHRTHGDTAGLKWSPEYASWASMIQRCTNPNVKAYPDYGGRGITVCARWLRSYAAFLKDMGRRPSAKHSLDRHPNNDGDYKPSNCRWATRGQQNSNQRKRATK